MKKIIFLWLTIVSFASFGQTPHTDAYLENRLDSLIAGKTFQSRPSSNLTQQIIDSKVSILAPKLTNSSTLGHIWTSTGTSGLGSWQVNSGGTITIGSTPISGGTSGRLLFNVGGFVQELALGTGIAGSLGTNVGSAGAPTLFNGALGTPSSGTLTNATGLPPITGLVGWPANASGALTNNGSGTLSWVAPSIAGAWALASGGTLTGTNTIAAGSNPINFTSSLTDAITLSGANVARTSIVIENTNTLGNASFYFQNNRGSFNAYGGLLTSGSSAVGSFLGVANADLTQLIADGANSTGLAIGTLTNTSLHFGTNGTRRGGFSGAGVFDIATTPTKNNEPAQILTRNSGTGAIEYTDAGIIASTSKVGYEHRAWNNGALPSSSVASVSYHSNAYYANKTTLVARVTVVAVKTDGTASAHSTVTIRYRKDNSGTFNLDDAGTDITSDITILADVVGEINGTNPSIKVTMGVASGTFEVSQSVDFTWVTN